MTQRTSAGTIRRNSLGTVALVSGLAVFLGACGGGAEDPGARAMVAGIAGLQPKVSEDRRSALAGRRAGGRTKEASVAALAAMTWLERRFPQLFSNGSALLDLDYEGASYVVRHYPGSDIYIAVSDGTLYALGAFTHHRVQAFGPAWLVACTIDGVDCPANVPVDPLVAKPRNVCAPSKAPQPGDRAVSVYRYSGDVTGRVSFTSEVGAATVLQGQQVLPIEVTTDGTLSNGVQTIPVQDWVISYERTDARGIQWRLGQLQQMTTLTATGARVTTTTQQLYNPALPDSEYTMQPGDHLVKTSSRTSTQLEPVALLATTSSYTETFNFRTLETITVLGRSYETCQYTVDGGWTRWLQVGTGKVVKQFQARGRAPGITIELEP